ncbi:hypothetical protein R3P38DRAFT_3288657 [Favolaschia claudopus]|uniref:Uncharacterized protein n=1 Tax=Favolaschia claudopus TaxID=2862362 RepID=A0AAV9ZVS6_9AGAR
MLAFTTLVTPIFWLLASSSLVTAVSGPISPSADYFGVSLVVLNFVSDLVGPVGIGPIPKGCETQCSSLVPIFANASSQDMSVVCRANVVDQVNSCGDCGLQVLGFNQSVMDRSDLVLKSDCATFTAQQNSKKNGAAQISIRAGTFSLVAGVVLSVLL